MTGARKVKIPLPVVGFVSSGLGAGERASFLGIPGFVSRAKAHVGRPLTPVSVAGVARTTRRTVRRTVVKCANGVYNC